MKAILLAAGRGSRMQAATAQRPKCLTELAGKPLLTWQTEALQAAGVEEIALVTGYREDLLAEKTPHRFHNPDWANTNMVASLRCAAPWLSSHPCLISYSDIVYHPALVKALMAVDDDIAITYDTAWESLWQLRFSDVLADAETFRLDGKGHLTEIGKKPQSKEEIQGQYMGLLRFTPAGWEKVMRVLNTLPPERQQKLDMTSLLNLLLAHGEAIRTVPVQGQWCEVDSQSDVAIYHQQLESDRFWRHDWRTPEDIPACVPCHGGISR